MITPFGKSLRNIRMDRGMLLKDMAQDLDVTSSYLSAVEVGKRNVPEEWPRKIGKMYDLSDEEIENLELRVWNLTGDRYRHIERKYAGELSDRWRCPYCHGWTRVTWASGRAGIDEAWCSRCGRRMVYCQGLEDEMEGRK